MGKPEASSFRLELVKPAFDVTLSVSDIDAVLDYWKAHLGLAPQETMTIREGLTQHRTYVGKSLLKMNHHARPLPKDGSTGYRELVLGRAGAKERRTLTDPEGNRVTVEPAFSESGSEHLGLQLDVRSLARSREFYAGELGLQVEETAGRTRVGLGDSFLFLNEDTTAPSNPSFDGPGWRYPTIQVPDVEAVYRRMVERKWPEGRPITAFGTAVKFCFTRDPDGNWIEFIQRS